MADSDLRALERRFRETGAAEDEAAWLRARVRAGTLDSDRLEYAAWLNCAAARRVLGARAPKPLPGPEDWTSSEAPALTRFVDRLEAAAKPTAAAAAKAFLLQAWATAFPGDERLIELDQALESGAADGALALTLSEEGLSGLNALQHYAPQAMVQLWAGELTRGVSYTISATGNVTGVHEALRLALVSWALLDGSE